MTERLRELERALAEAPGDLRLLRQLADERKRRGRELLPDRIRADHWELVKIAAQGGIAGEMAVCALRFALFRDGGPAPWPSRLRGIRDDFWRTYQASSAAIDARLQRVMGLAPPSEPLADTHRSFVRRKLGRDRGRGRR